MTFYPITESQDQTDALEALYKAASSVAKEGMNLSTAKALTTNSMLLSLDNYD